jgi:hypothetical protein
MDGLIKTIKVRRGLTLHRSWHKSILKKIISLRSYFRKEHSEVINEKSGSSDVFTSSWFAYKQLLFILESDLPRAGRDTINNL